MQQVLLEIRLISVFGFFFYLQKHAQGLQIKQIIWGKDHPILRLVFTNYVVRISVQIPPLNISSFWLWSVLYGTEFFVMPFRKLK